MSETLDIASFIERSRRAPVLDVRTPTEYAWSAWWLPTASTTDWSIGTIGKRLGSLRAKQARQAVCDDALADACRHLLAYYDTAYRHRLNKRNATKQHHIDLPTPPTPDAFADQLLETTLV